MIYMPAGHRRGVGCFDGADSYYLRLSVTTRCNLRCMYCTDPTVPVIGNSEEISNHEFVELAASIDRVAPLGKIRLTGGEPLLRKDIAGLISILHQRFPHAELCMTTNGVFLEKYSSVLKDAGLDRINISLDALDETRFEGITGRPALRAVLGGLSSAIASGFRNIKINSVLLGSYSDGMLLEFVEFSRRMNCRLRFIELMPIGPGARIFSDEYISADDVIAKLLLHYQMVRKVDRQGVAKAVVFSDVRGEFPVEFITPVSHPFCSNCNRLRLDSHGCLFTCLRDDSGVDLLPLLREGKEERLSSMIASTIITKTMPLPQTYWPERRMDTIGG